MYIFKMDLEKIIQSAVGKGLLNDDQPSLVITETYVRQDSYKVSYIRMCLIWIIFNPELQHLEKPFQRVL